MFDLRYYQSELIAGARKAWEEHQSTAIISCTGSGKTEMYMSLAVEEAGRVLVLVHRDYLIGQPIDRLEAIGFNDVAVEKASERSEVGFRKAKVVFASVQSIGPESQAKRLNTFDPNQFSLVIVDEAHRGLATTYRRVLDHFKKNPRVKILLVTATPNRKDGVALRNVCDSVAGVYGPSSAMAEGWIVPVKFYRRDVASLDFSNVRMKGTDLDPEQVQNLLMQEKPLHEVCASLAEDTGPTIVFCPEVAVAGAYAQLMNSRYRPGRSVMLCAESPEEERERAGKMLAQGELDYIFNVNLYCLDSETEILTSEGWVGIDGMTFEHKVANWNPDGSIFFKEPQQIVRRRRFPDEKMVTLSGSRPALDIRVTDRHRMVTRHGKDAPWRIERAEDIAGKVREFPVCGNAEPHDVRAEQECRSISPRKIAYTAYQMRKQGVPPESARDEAISRLTRRSGLRYSDPSELTLDECELIGFWIGDGSVNHPPRGGMEYMLYQNVSNRNICHRIDTLLGKCGIHSIRRERANTNGNLQYRWSLPRGTGSGPQARGGVYRLEPYLSKSGSPLFWGLNADQFRALLRGLWMADGTSHNDDVEPGATYSICGGNRDLFDLLQAVAVCRGISVGITEHQSPPPYKPVLHLNVHNRTTHRVGKCPMVIESEPWRDERIWCVTVDTGNIVIRRHGTVMVTGNTEGYDLPNLLRVVWAAPTASLVRYTQGVGRVFRTHPSLRGHLVGGRDQSEQRRQLIEQSPKPFGIVVTYYPVNCKHELCDPVDILGGDDLDASVKAAAKQVQEETSRLNGGSKTEEDIETAKVFCDFRSVLNSRLKDLKARASFADKQFDPMSGRKGSGQAKDMAGLRAAVEGAATSWGDGEPATEKQRNWFKWKGAKADVVITLTKWRAAVVRDLFEMGVQLETALSYGKKQALKVRDELRSRNGGDAEGIPA